MKVFYNINEGVLEMKGRDLERFWALELRFEFNEDPSIAHRTFNTASIVFEAALSNGHMLSDEMTVWVALHCLLLRCRQRKARTGGRGMMMKRWGKKLDDARRNSYLDTKISDRCNSKSRTYFVSCLVIENGQIIVVFIHDPPNEPLVIPGCYAYCISDFDVFPKR